MLALVTAVLDWLGIIAFATTAALVASRKGMDLVGFALLGIVTGVGGGTMRDLLLGVPVFWVGQPSYLITCVLVSVLVFFTAHVAVSVSAKASASIGPAPARSCLSRLLL